MLAASEAAFTVLKNAGACNMARLGISIFLKSFRKMAVAADVGPRPARSGPTGSPA
jgi:threonine/homoserine/homoserine lactone efflux protein